MRSYIKSLKNLPFGVKYFFLMQIIMGIGTGIWNLDINYYLESRGFGTSEIGKIVAVGSVTTALFSILSGYLCDRYGCKKNIIIGCLLKTAAMFSVYFLVPENTVYIILFINGIGDSMILTCSYPYITSMVGDEEKSTAYTLLSNMIPGVVDGPMLNRIPEGEKGGFSGLRVLVNNIGTSLGITAAGNLLSVDNGIVIIYLITAFLLLMQVLVFVFGFMNYIE